MIAVEKGMQEKHKHTYENRNIFYELYGFDVLINNKMKPWLMEVNMCPSLNLKTSIDKEVKLPLLTDIMNLIGFSPHVKTKTIESLKRYNYNINKTEYKKKEDIQDLSADNCVEKLNPEDWKMLFEFDEEYHRKGNFERIFPNKENVEKFDPFFMTSRYNNLLLKKFLLCKGNILEKVCKKVKIKKS